MVHYTFRQYRGHALDRPTQTHPTPDPHPPRTHPLNPPNEPTHSTHALNPPTQPTHSTHPLNPPPTHNLANPPKETASYPNQEDQTRTTTPSNYHNWQPTTSTQISNIHHQPQHHLQPTTPNLTNPTHPYFHLLQLVGKGGVEFKGGSRHDRNCHNRRNRQTVKTVTAASWRCIS